MLHTRPMSLDELPLPPPPAERPASGAGGYLLSSVELRNGLDVRLLPVQALPAEVLRELQRLLARWPANPTSH